MKTKVLLAGCGLPVFTVVQRVMDKVGVTSYLVARYAKKVETSMVKQVDVAVIEWGEPEPFTGVLVGLRQLNPKIDIIVITSRDITHEEQSAATVVLRFDPSLELDPSLEMALEVVLGPKVKAS